MTEYFIAYVEQNPLLPNPKPKQGNSIYQTNCEEFTREFIEEFMKRHPHRMILFIKKLSNRKETENEGSGQTKT